MGLRSRHGAPRGVDQADHRRRGARPHRRARRAHGNEADPRAQGCGARDVGARRLPRVRQGDRLGGRAEARRRLRDRAGTPRPGRRRRHRERGDQSGRGRSAGRGIRPHVRELRFRPARGGEARRRAPVGGGGRGGAPLRGRRVRHRHVVVRRDLRPESPGRRGRAAPGLPARRHDRNGQLHARRPGEGVLRDSCAVPAAATARSTVAARMGKPATRARALRRPRLLARADTGDVCGAEPGRAGGLRRALQADLRAGDRSLRSARRPAGAQSRARRALPRVRRKANRGAPGGAAEYPYAYLQVVATKR